MECTCASPRLATLSLESSTDRWWTVHFSVRSDRNLKTARCSSRFSPATDRGEEQELAKQLQRQLSLAPQGVAEPAQLLGVASVAMARGGGAPWR